MSSFTITRSAELAGRDRALFRLLKLGIRGAHRVGLDSLGDVNFCSNNT